MNKVAEFILPLVLIFTLVSSSGGFDSNANKDESTPDPKDQRSYTRGDAVKPFGQGGYFGGHDTITAEGMLLKEEVHTQTDPDAGTRFIEEFSSKALPFLRQGAHDEDSTRILGMYIGSEAPLGDYGDGNFFHHFYDPDTGKGLPGFNSALEWRRHGDAVPRWYVDRWDFQVWE